MLMIYLHSVLNDQNRGNHFADDTSLMVHPNSRQFLQNQLNKMLDDLIAYMRKSRLNLNSDKIEFLFLTMIIIKNCPGLL